MKILKKLTALMCLLSLLALLPMHAFAAPMVDLTKTGTLTVHILDTKDKKAVSGGKISLYYIAEPISFFQYALTESYAKSGFDVETIGTMSASANAKAAESLVSFIEKNKLTANATAVPDTKGAVTFKNLKLGLYLVVQTTAGSKHYAIDPFLITVPQWDAAKKAWVYEVDAAPKTGTADPTTAPTTKPSGSSSSGSKLPQTGQLWWPVFAMSGLGAACLLVGWKRKKEA